MGILIAYFSRRGQNYWAGQIRDLEKGNTERMAELVHEAVGGDVVRIETAEDYPQDYTECTEVAKRELQQHVRPKLKGEPVDLGGYDTVFLGYPNWWGTCPMAVFSFLDQYDMDGKRIVPFCTNEGSGMGGSVKQLRRACPGAKVEDGLAVVGHEVSDAHDRVIAWAKAEASKRS